MPTKRQTFERWGEALAEYLTKKGYKIIERNLRTLLEKLILSLKLMI